MSLYSDGMLNVHLFCLFFYNGLTPPACSTLPTFDILNKSLEKHGENIIIKLFSLIKNGI